MNRILIAQLNVHMAETPLPKYFNIRQTVVHHILSVAQRFMVQGFDPELEILSVWGFTSAPCDHMGFLLVSVFFSHLPKHTGMWLSCSKMPLGMNKCVCVCGPIKDVPLAFT